MADDFGENYRSFDRYLACVALRHAGQVKVGGSLYLIPGDCGNRVGILRARGLRNWTGQDYLVIRFFFGRLGCARVTNTRNRYNGSGAESIYIHTGMKNETEVVVFTLKFGYTLQICGILTYSGWEGH